MGGKARVPSSEARVRAVVHFWYSYSVQERQMTETSYSFARAHLAELCNQVAADREAVIIRRRNGEDVALIAADELSSILETVHLLRSPKNAERLIAAIESARRGDGAPETVHELRAEFGLETGT
jgi:antitoxin YefM